MLCGGLLYEELAPLGRIVREYLFNVAEQNGRSSTPNGDSTSTHAKRYVRNTEISIPVIEQVTFAHQ